MRSIIFLMILLLIIPNVFSATIISSSQNVTIGETFNLKIYAEHQYTITIPNGCEATKYNDKVKDGVLYASIEDYPEFRCMDNGVKKFDGRAYIQGNWVEIGEHYIEVKDPLEEVIVDNDTFVEEGLMEDLNISMNTSYNETASPGISIMWWIVIGLISILLLVAIIFAIGIFLAL